MSESEQTSAQNALPLRSLPSLQCMRSVNLDRIHLPRICGLLHNKDFCHHHRSSVPCFPFSICTPSQNQYLPLNLYKVRVSGASSSPLVLHSHDFHLLFQLLQHAQHQRSSYARAYRFFRRILSHVLPWTQCPRATRSHCQPWSCFWPCPHDIRRSGLQGLNDLRGHSSLQMLILHNQGR
jgi:hypothetical protein